MEALSDEQLYSKIGMRSTSSRYSDYDNNPNKSALHYLQDGVYKNWFVREADAEARGGWGSAPMCGTWQNLWSYSWPMVSLMERQGGEQDRA